MATSDDNKKKWLTGPFIGVVFNVVVWLVMGIYYIGVHRTEMKELKTGFSQFETSIHQNESRISVLENQKFVNNAVDDKLGNHDSRITRLEDAIPQIALLAQQVSQIKESQTEMRGDMKKLPEIQVQIAELKSLVEKSLLHKQ